MADAQLIVDVILRAVDNSMNQTMSKFNEWLNKADVRFLSLIFGGMSLQRVFGGVLRSLYQGYQEATDQTERFNLSVDQMIGAFQFLKFTIFDAFANNQFVLDAIQWITEKLVMLGQFFDDNPNLATTIIGVTGALFALGALSVTAGSVWQLFGAGGTLAQMIVGMRALYTVVVKAGLALIAFMGLPLIVAVSVLGAGWAFSRWNDEINNVLSGMGNLGNRLRVVTNTLAGVWQLVMLNINVMEFLYKFSIKNLINWLNRLGGRFQWLQKVTEPIVKTLEYMAELLGWVADTSQDGVGSLKELNEKLSSLNNGFFAAHHPIDEYNEDLEDLGYTTDHVSTEMKNFKLDLEDLYGPITEINSVVDEATTKFLEEVGAIDDLSGATIDYSNYINTTAIPTMDNEKDSVDRLTRSYNDLADAKRRAGGLSGPTSPMPGMTRSNFISVYSG